MGSAAGWIATASLLARIVLAAPAEGDGALSASPLPVSHETPWLAGLLNGNASNIDLTAADPDWHIARRVSVAADTPPPASVRREYQLLREALQTHLGMAQAGGWPSVPDSAELRAGSRDPAVAVLRKRLRASSDYVSEMGADPWFFDTGMDVAVRRFQERHGLPVTGVFDEPTRTAANVPLADRIGQIAVTLERWRWLPLDLGSSYVWVNIGSTSLEVMQAGRSVLAMRVIVGHPDRPTPSLAGELRQVVFNPTWSVPRTIAVADLLPRQVEDPGFLASRGFRVFAANGAGPALDPSRVDWPGLGPGRFPYRLRQDAGPGNSLGRIKIAWDNPYDIYLHDTPAKGLFALGRRTLSSGCVRLEDAAALATFLLEQDRAWSPAMTKARLASSATQVINLQARLPIYIVYLTTWVVADGAVHFRRDTYGRDARVLAALQASYPG